MLEVPLMIRFVQMAARLQSHLYERHIITQQSRGLCEGGLSVRSRTNTRPFVPGIYSQGSTLSA